MRPYFQLKGISQWLALALMLFTGQQKRMRFSALTTTSFSTDEFRVEHSERTANNNNNKQPVKVFLLAGQSNMVGRGKVAHLDEQMKSGNSTESEFRAAIWDGKGYKTRDDVFVQWEERHGNLTVRLSDEFSVVGCFGPELMFGWTIGDAFEETVLLIKTAWGSKSLAVDFRPPSSGRGNYTGQLIDDSPDGYGFYYRKMIMKIHRTLANIADFVPGFDEDSGYSVEGMVWFQGWDDVLYRESINEYEYNLGNLIRDVRLDLGLPGLPFSK